MTNSLPTVGDSSGAWGTQLNTWLLGAHNADGSLVNLTPTAVKTANYTATASQLVPVDTTSGPVTVTLPTAPQNGTQQCVKMVIQGSTSHVPNFVTVAAGGSDVFNKAGGAVTVTLKLSGQGVFLEYGNGIWYVMSDDLPLGQLDIRYVNWINVMSYGATGNGSTDDTAAIQAAINAATGAADPTTTTRVPVAPVYLPPGIYKVTTDLMIRSVLNFKLVGAGSGQTIIYASGTGFTQAVLFIDGSADGVFEGFDVRGDGTEKCGSNNLWDGIRLDGIGASRTMPGIVTTNNSATVTLTVNSSPTGDQHYYDVGASVTGTGIPSGTTILSATPGTGYLLSKNCTANGTVTITITALSAYHAARSTTANVFRDIRVRALKSVNGMSLEGNGSSQLDGTVLDNVVVTGGQTAGSWSGTGLYQCGFVFGSGTFANNYDHVGTGVSSAAYYYGYKVNVSSFALHGAQPAANFSDFWVYPNGQTTITNVQSQNSGQFLVNPSGFAPLPVSVSDVYSISVYAQAGSPIITLAGGLWKISNFSAELITLPSTWDSPVITVNGGGANTKPCELVLDNITLNGAKTTCIVPTANRSNISVRNYNNYNPATGFYTTAAGDLMSYYTGSSWTNL